jgi:nicotinate-nucleotide--dimethylbenzimidazole phosphoribosyltransferase
MTRRPGPLPFNDILDLIDELPAGPSRSSCRPLVTDDQQSGVGLPARGGMLDMLAAWLADWQGRSQPLLRRPVLTVFAASHGQAAIAASGEHLSSIETLVLAAQQQTALVCRLCERFGLGLRVFELAPELPVGDMTVEASMEEADCAATIAYGMEATAGGADLLVVRALAAGHGASVAALAAGLFGPRNEGHLANFAAKALALHDGHMEAPLEILRRLGGRENAALAGAIVAARMQQVPVILDGSGAVAVAVLLERLRTGAAAHCVVAADDGHPDFARLRAALNRPVLLGGSYPETDGSAGALAASLVQAAAELHGGAGSTD